MRLLVSGCTATVRQLAPEFPGHLGHLLTPQTGNGMAATLATGLPWAADNGCFNGLDARAFRRLLARCKDAPRCRFVVCPDAVGDAAATLRLWGEWADECRACGQPVAFVGQDGAEARAAEIPWGGLDAWFVGGSTRWKLSPASFALIAEAKRRGKWVHMGRVNTLRRLRAAYDAGCDSVDGTSMSMFGATYIRRFAGWLQALERQPVLWD